MKVCTFPIFNSVTKEWYVPEFRMKALSVYNREDDHLISPCWAVKFNNHSDNLEVITTWISTNTVSYRGWIDYDVLFYEEADAMLCFLRFA